MIPPKWLESKINLGYWCWLVGGRVLEFNFRKVNYELCAVHAQGIMCKFSYLCVGMGFFFLMIILNRNIRCLGDLDKRAKVRDFLNLFRIDLVVPITFFDLLGELGLMNGWFLTLLVPREDNLLGGMENFLRKFVNLILDSLFWWN